MNSNWVLHVKFGHLLDWVNVFSCHLSSICTYLFQVLQRKTEEAAMATKRLKELLEARKSNGRETSGIFLFRVYYDFAKLYSF